MKKTIRIFEEKFFDDDEKRVLFEYESENNTWNKTIDQARKKGIKLGGADFSNKDLSNVDFSNLFLRGANFTNSNLSGSNFTNSILGSTKMWNGNFTNACFVNADLKGSYFWNAIISNANFENAFIIDANFTNTKPQDNVPSVEECLNKLPENERDFWRNGKRLL